MSNEIKNLNEYCGFMQEYFLGQLILNIKDNDDTKDNILKSNTMFQIARIIGKTLRNVLSEVKNIKVDKDYIYIKKNVVL